MDPNADDPGDDPQRLTSSFHGTHVAGTIGAFTNNGQGVAGVNWISPLMILRVLAVRGKSLARSRARELRSLARHEEEVNAWSFTTTRNTARGRKPLAPFGLRAAQAHLLRCPSSAMLWHGLRWFALHLHPWRPQRGPRDFYHGLLGKGGGTIFDMSEAIRYAAGLPNVSGQIPPRKARVINMSLGGEHFSYDLADAVAAAQAQNPVVVAAAGNENTSRLGYPASYEGVISVGATDLSGGRAPYSNFGSRIEVVAPGGNLAEDRDGDGYKDGIVSTWWDEDQNEPNYTLMVGTSMAAPHVAGVVSLMLAVNPNLTPSQVRQIVQQTAVDLAARGKSPAGRVAGAMGADARRTNAGHAKA